MIKYGIGEKEKNEIQRKHAKRIEERPLYGQFWKATEDVCGTKKLGFLEKKRTIITRNRAHDQTYKDKQLVKIYVWGGVNRM